MVTRGRVEAKECWAVLSCSSRVWLFATPWTVSLPASSAHEIHRARILEWVAVFTPGDLPNPGIEPVSPALQADSLGPSHRVRRLKRDDEDAWDPHGVFVLSEGCRGGYSWPIVEAQHLMSSCGLFHLAEGSWAQNGSHQSGADLRPHKCRVPGVYWMHCEIWNLRCFMYI